jgi:hypothetical protein
LHDLLFATAGDNEIGGKDAPPAQQRPRLATIPAAAVLTGVTSAIAFLPHRLSTVVSNLASARGCIGCNAEHFVTCGRP